MKVALSTIGKFHSFDLARELYARGALSLILSGYPRFKLGNESLPHELIRTFPLIHGLYMAFPWRHRLGRYWIEQWEYLDQWSFGIFVARNLPECDVYVGLSGSSLRAGEKAKTRGARYVCDRGSSHIRAQDEILREEHERWGLPYPGIDPRIIDAEESEYAEADCITVPSHFAYRSFLSQRIAPEKLRLLPYGVNLSLFEPAETPPEGRFDVLFGGGMSLRKGIPYLVQAFQQLRHPAKSLSFVGTPSASMIEFLRQRSLWPKEARVLGHVPQPQLKNVMSRSHVMVLPSVEEGLALVQAQAMACACPVIGTHNTGAEDIFTNSQEGFIVPIRDPDALTERLQYLADHPEERAQMGQRALAKVQDFGGWHRYGGKAMAIYTALAGVPAKPLG
ncbi:MAG TPA: glycosyltransferase family 4 protein [Methylocella sp.]|nr:glycosyltransferase family 4 protein [Methylocella sp.]